MIKSISLLFALVSFCSLLNSIEVGGHLTEYTNYQPRWTETQKSPCIDTGNPDGEWDEDIKSPCIDTGNPDGDNDGLRWHQDPNDQDSDGSRRDIGAIPAVDHKHDYWKLPYYMIDNNLKWISFPSVDITEGNNEMYYMMQGLTNPSIDALEYMNWIEVGSGYEYFFSNANGWLYGDFVVSAPQGFKLQMQEDCYDPYILEVSGKLADPDVTSIPLLGNGQENWIGYFLEESMDAKEAFGGVWDNLYRIKTQYWSMSRIEGTDDWFSGLNTTLQYGDMVVVHAYDDCDLYWASDGVPQDPKEKKATENFDFTEEPDYVPVYVAVDPEDDVKEIGVFVEGECKGAAVVQSEVIDINAYIVGVEGEVEFIKYYEERAPLQAQEDYFVYNPQTNQSESGKIRLSQDRNYYYVSFREEDAYQVPAVFSLADNYPNPFNPTTTISYSIPQDENVKLSIYNVKGQKVTTLVNGNQTAGSYNAVWNGADKSNKKVSSGIYFYKIEAGKNTEMKKMVLIK
jgi:hypothetical protein